MNHNYMILENKQVTGEEYTVRMVEQNQIPELLNCQVRKRDGSTYLYYEITSRQPLEQIYAKKNMKSQDIEQLLFGIRSALERGRQYLLNPEDMILQPEFIYMNAESRQLQLCYYPHLPEREGVSFGELAEYILKHLDHSDRKAVELGYELFRQASMENFSLSETLKNLLWRQRNKEAEMAGEMEDRQRGAQQPVPENRDGRMMESSEMPYCLTKESLTKEKRGKTLDNSFAETGFENEGKTYNTEEGGLQKEERCRKKTERRKEIRGDDLREGHLAERYLAGTGRKRQIREDDLGEGDRAGFGRRNGSKIKKDNAGKRKGGALAKKQKNIILCTCFIVTLAALFGAAVYFFHFDLTQTGGLAFLLLAVIWILYNSVCKEKKKKTDYWIEDEEEEDPEEDYMELLMKGMENPAAEEEISTDTEALCGETRCLTDEEYRYPVRLISVEPEQYPDIILNQRKTIIGKMRGQADVILSFDSISRIHASLECRKKQCFVIDLNSMNGTFVNGVRLAPQEEVELRDGDKISFALLHYILNV
ncbi:MAG: DUF6382 domain-containing protein [Lachnospiraceae bacterium]|nr:DUF6382 domain-containing protein [Lachnospiraceae bacterium]MDD3794961.1 DUF6382 domain-containing protein [Lachnospiraceae bacterium]